MFKLGCYQNKSAQSCRRKICYLNKNMFSFDVTAYLSDQFCKRCVVLELDSVFSQGVCLFSKYSGFNIQPNKPCIASDQDLI